MLKKFMLMAAVAALVGTSAMAADTPAKPERSFWAQFGRDVLLYIPNRLADTADMFTLKLGAGATFDAKVQVTSLMQFGVDHGPYYFIGKGFNRQWGGGYQENAEFGMFCLNNDNIVVDDTFGSFSEFAMEKKFGLPNCEQEPYRENQLDFWNIGARAGLGVNCEALVHLQELPDLVLGFFCLDISKDDYK